MMAFLGRYAHQDVERLLDWSVRDVCALAAAVAELLKEEGERLPSPDDP